MYVGVHVCVCVCVCVLFFALWRMVFPGCVGIRKAMRVVSRMRDGRVGGRRRGRPRYSYNAGRSGVFYFHVSVRSSWRDSRVTFSSFGTLVLW